MNIDGLLLGASLALFLNVEKGLFTKRLKPPPLVAHLALAMLLLFSICATLSIDYNFVSLNPFVPISKMPYPLNQPTFIIEIVAVILVWSITTNPDSRLMSVLAPPTLVYIGKISYGLYLWHFPINGLMDYSGFRRDYGMWASILMIVLSFIFASISFHFLEKPILARWKVPRKKASAMSSSAQLA